MSRLCFEAKTVRHRFYFLPLISLRFSPIVFFYDAAKHNIPHHIDLSLTESFPRAGEHGRSRRTTGHTYSQHNQSVRLIIFILTYPEV
jgi:hypothetical protein